MNLSGIVYTLAGSLGVIFFAATALRNVEAHLALSDHAAGAFLTISGRVESVEQSEGLRSKFVVRVDTDTMDFVGGDPYPVCYRYGSATAGHIGRGEQIWIQVERARYMGQRVEARKGGSNEVPIASLATSSRQFLGLQTYMNWWKHQNLTRLALAPPLVLLSAALLLRGWQFLTEKSRRKALVVGDRPSWRRPGFRPGQ